MCIRDSQKCFEQFGDLTTAVVISAPDMREGVDEVDESTDDMVVAFWNKMMQQYGNADDYEDTLKNKFIDGEIDIMIVCSKLLTGFDAPLTQVLYIDKELKMCIRDRDEEKFSHVATLQEIRDNDYNLNIPRYVDTFEAEELIDIDQVQKNIADIEAELADVQAQMKKYMEELGL